jgi:hypothetical protein
VRKAVESSGVQKFKSSGVRRGKGEEPFGRLRVDILRRMSRAEDAGCEEVCEDLLRKAALSCEP